MDREEEEGWGGKLLEEDLEGKRKESKRREEKNVIRGIFRRKKTESKR